MPRDGATRGPRRQQNRCPTPICPSPTPPPRLGKSEDTLRRDNRQGKFPNTEKRDGVTFYAIVDLVANKLLDPLRADVAPELAGRSRAERDLAEARQQLAVLRTELEAARALAAHHVDEIKFMRQLFKTREVA